MTNTTPPDLGYIDVEDLKKRVTGYGVIAQEVVDLLPVRNVVNRLEQYFPFKPTDREAIEFWTREGNAGLMNVARSANIPPTQAQFRRHYEMTHVDKFAYGYEYDVLEKSEDDFTIKDAQDAATWFAAVRQYKQIYALTNGAGYTVEADGYWTATDPTDKIYDCLDHLNDWGWNDGALGKALVLYPTRVGKGLKSSQFVNGSYTQRTKDISSNYNNAVEFIPVYPFRTASAGRKIDQLLETESDALGNDALVVVANGETILKSREYRFRRTPSVFTEAVKDYGITTVLHRQTGCKIVPSGNADDTDDTDLLSDASTSIFVCKITGVAEARS